MAVRVSFPGPFAVLLFPSLVLLGCSKPPQETYPVMGVVMWSDGKPAVELNGGMVGLQMIEGVSVPVSPVGTIGPDASFTLKTYRQGDGAPAGKYRASVRLPPPEDGQPIRQSPLMDSRFQSYRKSPLEVTVLEQSNELKLTIERAPRK